MNEFFHVITSLPTLIFTVLLGFVVLYWLLVIVGALDLDFLEGADAIGDGVDGAVEGVFDGIDSDPDVDLPEGQGNSPLVALVESLGLRGVPITLWLSLVVLIAWMLTALGTHYTAPLLFGTTGPLIGSGLVVVGSVFVAALVTGLIVKPIGRLFVPHVAIENRSLIGKVCTITTLRVDGAFGQAEISDGGAGLLIQVRCPDSNDLTKGDHALIFDYNTLEHAFQVSRYEEPSVPTREMLAR